MAVYVKQPFQINIPGYQNWLSTKNCLFFGHSSTHCATHSLPQPVYVRKGNNVYEVFVLVP